MDEERRSVCFFFTKEKALKLFQTRAVGSPPFEFGHEQGADVEVKTASKVGEVDGYFVDVRGRAHELQLAFNSFCGELGYKGGTDASEEWEYLDDSSQYQGPFSKDRLRGWTKAGHLDPAKMMRNIKMDSWVSVQSLLTLDLSLNGPLAPKIPENVPNQEDNGEWQISTGWSRGTPGPHGSRSSFGGRGSSEQSENTQSSESHAHELGAPPNLSACSQIGYRSMPARESAEDSSMATKEPPAVSGWGPPPPKRPQTRLGWGTARLSETRTPRPLGVIPPAHGASEMQGQSWGRVEPLSTLSQTSTPPKPIAQSSDSAGQKHESAGWGSQPVVGKSSSLGWGKRTEHENKPALRPIGVQPSPNDGWGPKPEEVKNPSSGWGPVSVQKVSSGWGSQPRVERGQSSHPRSGPVSSTPSLASIAEGPPGFPQKKPTGWGPEPVKTEKVSTGWDAPWSNQIPDDMKPTQSSRQHDASLDGDWGPKLNQQSLEGGNDSQGMNAKDDKYTWALGGSSDQSHGQRSTESHGQDEWRQQGQEREFGDGWGDSYAGNRGHGFGARSRYRSRETGWREDWQNPSPDSYSGNGWGESGNRSHEGGGNRDECSRGRGIGRGTRGRGRGSRGDFGGREGYQGQREQGMDENSLRNRLDRMERSPGYTYGKVASGILDMLNSTGKTSIGSSQEWHDLFTQTMEIIVMGLSALIQHLLQLEYGDIWLDIVLIRPPWGCADLLRVMAKHWNSIFSPHFSRLVMFQRDELEFLLKKNRREGATVEDTFRFISCSKHMLNVFNYPSAERLEGHLPGSQQGPKQNKPDATKEEVMEGLMEARRSVHAMHDQCEARIKDLLGEPGDGGDPQPSDGWKDTSHNEGMGWASSGAQNPQQDCSGAWQSGNAGNQQGRWDKASTQTSKHQGEWGSTSTRPANGWRRENQVSGTGRDNDLLPNQTPDSKSIGWCSGLAGQIRDPKSIDWCSGEPGDNLKPKCNEWSSHPPKQAPDFAAVDWSTVQSGQAPAPKGINWSGTQPNQPFEIETQQGGVDSLQSGSLNNAVTNKASEAGWAPFKGVSHSVVRGWVENKKPQDNVECCDIHNLSPESRLRAWTNNFQSQGPRDGKSKAKDSGLNADSCENPKDINEGDVARRGRGFETGRSFNKGLWADNPQQDDTGEIHRISPKPMAEDRWKKATIDAEVVGTSQKTGDVPSADGGNDTHISATRESVGDSELSESLWDLTLEETVQGAVVDWTWIRGITAAYPLKGVEGKDILASIRDAMKGVATQAKHTGVVEKLSHGDKASIKKSMYHVLSVADALDQIDGEIRNRSQVVVVVLKLISRLKDFLMDIYNPCMLGTTIVLLGHHDEEYAQRFLAELEKWSTNSITHKMVQFFRFIGTTLGEVMMNTK